MKSSYFAVSSSQHEAKAQLRNMDDGFQWFITIRTQSLVITTQIIEQYLKDNTTQISATEGGGLGMSKYNCRYHSPYTHTEFFAGSNGS